jgi:hypothetical protein
MSMLGFLPTMRASSWRPTGGSPLKLLRSVWNPEGVVACFQRKRGRARTLFEARLHRRGAVRRCSRPRCQGWSLQRRRRRVSLRGIVSATLLSGAREPASVAIGEGR